MKIYIQKTLVWLGALLCAVLFWALMAWAGVTILSGCTIRKPDPVPPAPAKTTAHVADAQKVAGALTDKARTADERGLIPRSTDSGTLVRLAVTNEQYVGSPAVRVDAEDQKVVAALIGSMQRQEEQYRQDRAAWEQRIDAISRDRDRAEVRATGLAGQVEALKIRLFWGAVILVGLCLVFPAVSGLVVRFVASRIRGHLGQVVEGVEAFMEKSPQSAEALKAHLSRKMDTTAKTLVKQIKIDKKI
jgi:hypothetical protein